MGILWAVDFLNRKSVEVIESKYNLQTSSLLCGGIP